MWLNKQPRETLDTWIRHTATPMLSTKPDGEILWVNGAFEGLLGYTSVELVGKKTWIELTKPDDDLDADRELVAETVSGKRVDYQLQKHYVSKSGTPQLVVIDVLRYPIEGEFQFFLVAVCPVERGIELAMTQLVEIRKLLIELMDVKPSGLTFDKAIQFSKDHPMIATFVGLLFAVLLFGNRVIEIFQMLRPGGGE